MMKIVLCTTSKFLTSNSVPIHAIIRAIVIATSLYSTHKCYYHLIMILLCNLELNMLHSIISYKEYYSNNSSITHCIVF